MELIQYSINWCKGEIFGSAIWTVYGTGVLVGAILLRKAGNTPYTNALFVPLLVVGLFYAGAGGAGRDIADFIFI